MRVFYYTGRTTNTAYEAQITRLYQLVDIATGRPSSVPPWLACTPGI